MIRFRKPVVLLLSALMLLFSLQSRVLGEADSSRRISYQETIFNENQGLLTGESNAVADTFDAMFSTRPYRNKMKLEDVVAEIKRVSGTQLSPRVVDAFLALVEDGTISEDMPVDETL